MRSIELLAPAKNLECGIAAIDHGADAVYIGAERFGARVAAGNSVEDIAQLCTYAHQYGAKVYVTVNTIIYDEELEDTQRLLQDLQAANVDAILVQDMGICQLSTVNCQLSTVNCQLSTVNSQLSIDLHASTQTDNRSIEKVRWLRSIGFRRVVLARELSLKEIAAIHQAVPDVELEVFVHGALCVSYSGQCYASQYCFGRSANRGACAQFCRLPFDLEDADGNVIERGRHLLSLKDMCRIDQLEELMEAGAVSFKIEGRLKDIDYVKNVTAAYSQRLNEIIDSHPDKYHRASLGTCTYSFTPNLQKTFNRGFTDYFLYGRKPDIFSPDTPKALGEYVGKVKEIRGNSFNVAGTASFANGDGLCFFREEGRRSMEEGRRRKEEGEMSMVNGQRSMILEGFRVNRAEGNRLYPYQMPEGIRPGVALYRNFDQAFQRLMTGKTAVRKIAVEMTLREVDHGFELQMGSRRVCFPMEKQIAQKPQHENIIRQLSKLGNTPYECTSVHLVPQDFPFFIPSSVLTEMRRNISEKFIVNSEETATAVAFTPSDHIPSDFVPAYCAEENSQLSTVNSQLHKKYPYLFNIANQQARAFYEQQGLKDITPAFELSPVKNPLIMQCRHCLKYSMGYCMRHGGEKPRWKEPLYLKLDDGRRFRLEFQCSDCQMNVYGAHPDPPQRREEER